MGQWITSKQRIETSELRIGLRRTRRLHAGVLHANERRGAIVSSGARHLLPALAEGSKRVTQFQPPRIALDCSHCTSLTLRTRSATRAARRGCAALEANPQAPGAARIRCRTHNTPFGCSLAHSCTCSLIKLARLTSLSTQPTSSSLLCSFLNLLGTLSACVILGPSNSRRFCPAKSGAWIVE